MPIAQSRTFIHVDKNLSPRAPVSMMMVRTLCWLAVASLLTACGSIQYTVDDGRYVNEAMLANIRTLGSGEQSIRPAIVRAATLKPAVCETQWELPFAVASSDGLEKNDRIAWVRALKVDERLTVIASTPESALDLGDKIVEINGYRSDSGEKMSNTLKAWRDDGKPFQIVTADGRAVRYAIASVPRPCDDYLAIQTGCTGLSLVVQHAST